MSHYAKIKKFNVSNGVGIRTAIFFSGCDFACPNCFNKELWDCNYGYIYDENTKTEIWQSMTTHIAGLSILGGEPLSSYNIDTVTALCKQFKNDFTDKTIWLWTGNLFEDVCDLEVMNYIDVVIDGRFKEYLKQPNLQFRGSSNQRIIDVKATKQTGNIVTLNF